MIRYLQILIVTTILPSCVTNGLHSSARTPSEILYVSVPISSQGLFSSGIEGPAVDKEGNLYAVNFAGGGTIGILRHNKEPELWLTLPEGSIANSIRFDNEGRMFVADYKKHQLFLIHLATKKIEILFNKNEMNQPNDFAISPSGSMYFSDPSWRDRKKGGIWVYNLGEEPYLAASNLAAVNGIDIHPHEDKVYFGESISGAIYAMSIRHGKLVDKKLFYKFEPDTIDGIRFDMMGNLYVARILKASVDVVSPIGEHIRSIPLHGQKPTNIAFGGKDGKTVFVTMKDGGYIESFRVEIPGREWHLLHKK